MPQFIRYHLLFICLSLTVNIELLSGQDMDLAITPAKCFSEKSGSVQIKISKGITPYIFVLSLDSLRKSEIKRSPLLKEGIYSFKEIAAGKYFVTAICGDGKVYSQKAAIDQPSQLRAGKILIETYPSSASAMDGSIVSNPMGGTPPYIFSWEGAQAKGTGNKISRIGIGIYKCTVKDSQGCGPVSSTIFLGSKAASKSTSCIHCINPGNNNLIAESVHLIIN